MHIDLRYFDVGQYMRAGFVRFIIGVCMFIALYFVAQVHFLLALLGSYAIARVTYPAVAYLVKYILARDAQAGWREVDTASDQVRSQSVSSKINRAISEAFDNPYQTYSVIEASKAIQNILGSAEKTTLPMVADGANDLSADDKQYLHAVQAVEIFYGCYLHLLLNEKEDRYFFDTYIEYLCEAIAELHAAPTPLQWID